jgi:hypothetical protein
LEQQAMTTKSAFVALLALLSLLLGRVASGDDAAPLRKGAWPIRNSRNYQPTERELRAMNRRDLSPDQAREVDRLYGELLCNGEKDHKRYSSPKH